MGREEKAFLGKQTSYRSEWKPLRRGRKGDRRTGGSSGFVNREVSIEMVCALAFRETSEGLLSTFRKDPGKKVKPLSRLCPSASGGWVDLSLRPSQPSSDNYTPSEWRANRIRVTALRLESCFL